MSHLTDLADLIDIRRRASKDGSRPTHERERFARLMEQDMADNAKEIVAALRAAGGAPVVPLPGLHARALGVINEFRGVMQWSGFNMNARLGEAIEVIEALMQNDAPKMLMTDYEVAEHRVGCEEYATGIYVRAKRGDKFGSYDIAELTRESLKAWLRSRGGANDWAEDTVLILLDYRPTPNNEAAPESSAPKVSRPWCPGCNNQGRPFVANRYPEKLCAACAAKFHGGASEGRVP